MLAEYLGLTIGRLPERTFDLLVVGGGPAGLAAAVYGASEGLQHARLRHGRARGTGGHELADRELLRLSDGDLRRRPRPAGDDPGREVRCPADGAVYRCSLCTKTPATSLSSSLTAPLLPVERSSWRREPSTADSTWIASRSSRTPASTTPRPTWKLGCARAARSWWWAAATPPDRRRSSLPTRGARSRSSSERRTSEPTCPVISSIAFRAIPESRFSMKPT